MASADTLTAWEFPEFREIIDEGTYLPEQVFSVDETGLYWKRMPDRSYISKEEKLMPGYKAAKDRQTLVWWQCFWRYEAEASLSLSFRELKSP